MRIERLTPALDVERRAEGALHATQRERCDPDVGRQHRPVAGQRLGPPEPGRPAPAVRASVAETGAGRATRRASTRDIRPTTGCARSVPWKVTMCGAPRTARALQPARPWCA